jgi:hypothetical protein
MHIAMALGAREQCVSYLPRVEPSTSNRPLTIQPASDLCHAPQSSYWSLYAACSERRDNNRKSDAEPFPRQRTLEGFEVRYRLGASLAASESRRSDSRSLALTRQLNDAINASAVAKLEATR